MRQKRPQPHTRTVAQEVSEASDVGAKMQLFGRSQETREVAHATIAHGTAAEKLEPPPNNRAKSGRILPRQAQRLLRQPQKLDAKLGL
jgi:hypothetical protein